MDLRAAIKRLALQDPRVKEIIQGTPDTEYKIRP